MISYVYKCMSVMPSMIIEFPRWRSCKSFSFRLSAAPHLVEALAWFYCQHIFC